MKKLLSFAIFALFATSVLAQQEVTKFLGIPIDGTKSAMIEKLKAKGFTWNARMECLEGEFNGEDVYVKVVTNNNKVWRIFICDKIERDEADIRMRFNNLVSQFERNAKYKHPLFNFEDYSLSEDERIGIQMTVYHKQYQASYRQIPNPKDQELMSDEELKSYNEYLYGCFQYNSVWFTILKGGSYNKYIIGMFYDNERNHANGEDL